MLNNASTISSEAAVEADVVNRRAPAVLTSILVHMLVLLALPLLDLPSFRHRVSNSLESISAAHVEYGEYGEQQITQVVLSATLPDSEVATVAEQFAAKQANLVSAGGQSAGVRVEEPEASAALAGSISLSQSAQPVEGPSEFDPAGTRDSLPSRTDLSLQVPDPRLTATPLLTPGEVSNAVNQEQSLAIAAALRWIVSQQADKGHWQTGRVLVLVDDQVVQLHNNRVSATSLALLPLIAMQQTHQSGKYTKQMTRAVDFLLGPDTDPVSNDTEARKQRVHAQRSGKSLYFLDLTLMINCI